MSVLRCFVRAVDALGVVGIVGIVAKGILGNLKKLGTFAGKPANPNHCR